MTTTKTGEGKRKASQQSTNSDDTVDDVIATGRITADSWSRVAAGFNSVIREGSRINANANDNSASTNADVGGGVGVSTRGRGSLSGWTSCPLCEKYSNKKFALGRGIANHLRDVHTPWNPGKLAQKIHKRKYEATQREKQTRKKKKSKRLRLEKEEEDEDDISSMTSSFEPLTAWKPTDKEKKVYAITILEILEKIESVHTVETTRTILKQDEKLNNRNDDNGKMEDKSGKPVVVYRESLPPFLMAASKGDIINLQKLVEKAKQKDETKKSVAPKDDNNYLRTLLNTSDRHKSIADHWAAGGGHLDCLRYLYEIRETLSDVVVPDEVQQKQQQKERQKPRIRRRDGKTCLHYAARNGHVDCIRYLLKEQHQHTHHDVDEKSGDGTTPLHLACYGGHPETVKYLVEMNGADVKENNDWGCSCSHWIGMTISKSADSIRELCGYLSEQCGISFVDTQGQGHTALHKAAHRLNRHVIQWMADSKYSGGAGLQQKDKIKAGKPDLGNHKPSDIWRNMGGDDAFAQWLETDLGW